MLTQILGSQLTRNVPARSLPARGLPARGRPSRGRPSRGRPSRARPAQLDLMGEGSGDGQREPLRPRSGNVLQRS